MPSIEESTDSVPLRECWDIFTSFSLGRHEHTKCLQTNCRPTIQRRNSAHSCVQLEFLNSRESRRCLTMCRTRFCYDSSVVIFFRGTRRISHTKRTLAFTIEAFIYNAPEKIMALKGFIIIITICVNLNIFFDIYAS